MSATAFQRMRRAKEAKETLELAKVKKKEVQGPTVAEIKAMLDEKGIEYDAKAKKADLIKLLEGAE
ncbi:MAG: HeH/LEM domain-containing protein [Clostridia bacterium]|nr:HeH/LEM domain-containing protein [Clostridia bacterium]